MSIAMPTTPERIGLVAGWGRYPIVVAEALRKQGHEIVCLGIKGLADPKLREICDDYAEIGVAKLGGQIRYFRKRKVTRATMAGKIHKTILFQRFYWLKHLPDWKCLMTFYPHFITRTKDRKDDTLLGAVVDAFAKDGIHFAPATDFAPELLVRFGTLTNRKLSSAQQQDIDFGWQIAKEMGRLDIGQSIAVKGRAVIAVEAVEGTDQCIARAGELCPAGNFVVVKVAKPNQDMRFDVPTIGKGTLETMVEAGATVLAIEAEKTIIIDEHEVVEFANQHNLTVATFRDEQMSGRSAAA
ncbi:MAG: DUF1009 family protein [Pirellulaceae bacterium]|jgi:DUF1009 family protein